MPHIEYPAVSILVAARNEELVIARLLESLVELDYPVDNLQILVGNDASTDRTAEVVAAFARQYPHLSLIDIPADPSVFPMLKGKARVLAFLAHQATGRYFLYTDADMQLPPTWVQAMIAPYLQNPRMGTTVGVTTFRPTNWLAACMGLEWLSAIWIMKRFQQLGLPTTGMGNNMSVSAEAYWAVGGYEAMPFSIVEDFALYDAIIQKGYDFEHVFSHQVKGHTLPPPRYFEQRKRWIAGGMASDTPMKYLSLFQSFTFPILVLLSAFWPVVGIPLSIFSYLVHALMGTWAAVGVKSFYLLPYVLIYPIYMTVGWFVQFMYYLAPTKLVWKGREYR